MAIRRKISESDLKAIQNYLAATAVGPSTVRSYPGDTLITTRQFLGKLQLQALANKPADSFPQYLSILSRRLKVKLAALSSANENDDYFGISRKVINIFLHNAYYNRYLCGRFELDRFEDQFEIPIDSRTAKAIRSRAIKSGEAFPAQIPPPWKTIKALTPSTHAEYQRAALAIAQQQGTKRVHLDAYFWPSIG